MASIRVAGPLTFDSIVDGDGIRCVLWLQGCTHNCFECHNPLTHDLTGGQMVDVETIVDAFLSDPLQSGLTISGGEPFLQAASLLPLVKRVKQAGKSIWIYTGFTIEALTQPNHPTYDANMRLLGYCDVLIDGPFIAEKKDPRLKFRGSSNQRMIDVTKSIWLNAWIPID